jgi:hypothetical protein
LHQQEANDPNKSAQYQKFVKEVEDEKAKLREMEDDVDQASDDSFPASDPRSL